MGNYGRFLFGNPVTRVEQKDRTPKKAFILGVYPSAVHATWLDDEGGNLIRAVQVASEPEIFWTGNIYKAEDIISKIKLPLGAGILKPAPENNNGSSGRTLNKEYLEPLAITRKDVWLCDLVPYAMINENQLKALERDKVQEIIKKFNLPEPTLKHAIGKNRKIDDQRAEEILNELKASEAEYLVTLGDEPISEFINRYTDGNKKLAAIHPYGDVHKIKIEDLEINWIPLVHPRQAGSLGDSTYNWSKAHKAWAEIAPHLIPVSSK